MPRAEKGTITAAAIDSRAFGVLGSILSHGDGFRDSKGWAKILGDTDFDSHEHDVRFISSMPQSDSPEPSLVIFLLIMPDHAGAKWQPFRLTKFGSRLAVTGMFA